MALLASLQKHFFGGNFDENATSSHQNHIFSLKNRRKALAKLRQQKFFYRKSIWKQRSRMVRLVSLYKRQLRKQWMDRKVLRIFIQNFDYLSICFSEIGIFVTRVNDFKFCVELGLKISNFAKFQFFSNFVQKILISQIVCGF